MLELLREHGFTRVEGIDVSKQQIELAVARGVPARVGDARELLAASAGDYAAILAFDFIEHFDRDELLELVPAISRALAAGGRLVLHTPNGEGLMSGQVIYGDLTHLTIFTPGSLEQLLLRGLHGLRLREAGPAPPGCAAQHPRFVWSPVKLLVWCAGSRRESNGRSDRDDVLSLPEGRLS